MKHSQNVKYPFEWTTQTQCVCVLVGYYLPLFSIRIGCPLISIAVNKETFSIGF